MTVRLGVQSLGEVGGGKVVARIGKKVVGSAKVNARHRAKIVIKAKHLGSGVNKVRIGYAGSTSVSASKTVVAKVVVK